MPGSWFEETINGKLLWRHTSGACVYESTFWVQEREARRVAGEDVSTFCVWKANQASLDRPGEWDEEDDGYIYPTMGAAMVGALVIRELDEDA